MHDRIACWEAFGSCPPCCAAKALLQERGLLQLIGLAVGKAPTATYIDLGFWSRLGLGMQIFIQLLKKLAPKAKI